MGTLAGTVDTFLTSDLQLEMSDVSGPQAVAQRLFRRLTTPKGIFPFWPNEGYDAKAALLSKTPAWKIKQDVEIECARDEQVITVQVSAKIPSPGTTLILTIAFTTAEGSYAFTMNVTEAATTYIPLSKAA